MVEDAGRGYRQVVPSPKPFDIVEAESIKALFTPAMWSSPWARRHPRGAQGRQALRHPRRHRQGLRQRAAGRAAGRDVLVILTAVEQVAINFNKPDQKGLDDLTPAQAKVYMDENQFAKGSMLPKVQAAVKFAESKAGRTALITLLEKAKDASKARPVPGPSVKISPHCAERPRLAVQCRNPSA